MELSFYTEFVIGNSEKKIIIKSEGQLYPEESELYLKELQKNVIAVISNSVYFEFKGPVFLKSDMINFAEDLKDLISGRKKNVDLESSEEEILLSIKTKKKGFSVDFNFNQSSYKKERWTYTTGFIINEEDLVESFSNFVK